MKSLNRRTFIKSVGAVAAGAALVRDRAFSAPATKKRPVNVVLMIADDQRNDTIAALGNELIQTPSLDRLVKNGFAFRKAHCFGAQNAAVCVPTRAMLNMGRSLFRAPEDLGEFTTIGQTLRQAGYKTFAAGKWHNKTPGFVRSFSGGGNIFFGGMHADQYKMPIRDFDPAGVFPDSAIRTGTKFSSELFADATVDFINGHKGDEPFFCYLAFTSPHDPRTPPAPYNTMYDPAKMPLPKNWLAEHPFDNGDMKVRDELLAPFPRTEADTKKQLCDYYGMISSQDAQVGRVLKALDDRGLTDDTLIIYTSDHGLAIGSHGLFGKQNIYEHSQSIPLIFSGKNVLHNHTSDAVVYGFDIFPTICRLLDIEQPKSVEGHSLTDILEDPTAMVHEGSFHVYDHLIKGKKAGEKKPAGIKRGVSDGQFKLHHYDVYGEVTVRLFDLLNDPDEIHDLSEDPVAVKEVDRLTALLDLKRKEFGDNLV